MKLDVRTCAIVGAAFAVTACESGPSYSYYLVQSKFVAAAMDQQAPEIIPTPAYTQLAGGATTVAVRAPDRCSNSTTNQATGEAAAGGAILQTNCGVEMGEIERALTRAGYNVISWNILEREMERDKTASDVANRLGAQILFQINSLERSRKTLGQDARWERTYFTTDAAATKTAPLPLTEQARNLLSTNYLAPIEAKQNPRAYAVTLDASAIWVPTGQSIWYYRWTRAAERHRRIQASAAVRRRLRLRPVPVDGRARRTSGAAQHRARRRRVGRIERRRTARGRRARDLPRPVQAGGPQLRRFLLARPAVRAVAAGCGAGGSASSRGDPRARRSVDRRMVGTHVRRATTCG